MFDFLAILSAGAAVIPAETTEAVTEAVTEAAASATESTLTIGERLAVGGELLVIGLGTVFVVLCILWGVLELFRIVFDKSPKKIAQPEMLTSPAADKPEAGADDTELIAVITAAISAYTQQSDSQFRVVSFKRR